MKTSEFQEAAKEIAEMPEEEMREHVRKRLMEAGGAMMVFTAALAMVTQEQSLSVAQIKALADDLSSSIHPNADFDSMGAAFILVLIEAHEKRMRSDPDYVRMTEFVKKVLVTQLSSQVVDGAKRPTDPMFR